MAWQGAFELHEHVEHVEPREGRKQTSFLRCSPVRHGPCVQALVDAVFTALAPSRKSRLPWACYSLGTVFGPFARVWHDKPISLMPLPGRSRASSKALADELHELAASKSP